MVVIFLDLLGKLFFINEFEGYVSHITTYFNVIVSRSYLFVHFVHQ